MIHTNTYLHHTQSPANHEPQFQQSVTNSVAPWYVHIEATTQAPWCINVNKFHLTDNYHVIYLGEIPCTVTPQEKVNTCPCLDREVRINN